MPDKSLAAGVPKRLSAEELGKALSHEAARAQADYDGARTELAAHHAAMQKQVGDAERRIAELEPKVDAILAGEGAGLTSANARLLEKYLELQEQVRNARIARRAAYPATLPNPAEMKPGSPIG